MKVSQSLNGQVYPVCPLRASSKWKTSLEVSVHGHQNAWQTGGDGKESQVVVPPILREGQLKGPIWVHSSHCLHMQTWVVWVTKYFTDLCRVLAMLQTLIRVRRNIVDTKTHAWWDWWSIWPNRSGFLLYEREGKLKGPLWVSSSHCLHMQTRVVWVT